MLRPRRQTALTRVQDIPPEKSVKVSARLGAFWCISTTRRLSSLHFCKQNPAISSPRILTKATSVYAATGVRIIGSAVSPISSQSNKILHLAIYRLISNFAENKSEVCSLCRLVTLLISPYCSVLVSKVFEKFLETNWLIEERDPRQSETFLEPSAGMQPSGSAIRTCLEKGTG